MKKIYISLLLAVNIFSVSSMERKRTKNQNNHIEQDTYNALYNSISLDDNNNYIPEYSNHTSTAPVLYCEANQPGWQRLDDIQNAPYTNNQQLIMNEVLLTPIYKDANKTIIQQEKKPLLRINTLKPNEDIMQELNRTAVYFTQDSRVHKPDAEQQLLYLINQMNKAQNNNINENIMGQFAYNYQRNPDISFYHQSYFSALLFTLLGKYKLTVQKTGEPLPQHFNTKKTSLEKVFTPQLLTTDPKTIPSYAFDFDKYPAFFKILHSLRSSKTLPINSIDIFNNYCYGDQNILFQDYSNGSYNDLNSEFYAKAYHMLLLSSVDMYDLYNLIQIIDKAKIANDIWNEDDFEKIINNFQPDEPFLIKLMSMFNEDHFIHNVKKRLTLFCRLVKKYNLTRNNKITPTINQYQAYTVQSSLDIPLPTYLSYNYLFDKNQYAFAEFNQLYQDTKLLRHKSLKKINTYMARQQKK